jgi:hypothetical protein
MFWDQKHDFELMGGKRKKVAKIATPKFVTNATFLFFLPHRFVLKTFCLRKSLVNI